MAHRLSVIGTGYLGATHAACMAELGFEVIGVDVDPAKVDLLSSGRVPFYEPGLDEVLERNIKKLEARYPGLRFDADRANNRDTAAEQEAMAR